MHRAMRGVKGFFAELTIQDMVLLLSHLIQLLYRGKM
jgi:hypothetical protein